MRRSLAVDESEKTGDTMRGRTSQPAAALSSPIMIFPPLASIKILEWDGTPRECGEVWTLRKGSRVASRHFWTHPKGGEARLTIDGEWNRGSVAVDGRTLVDAGGGVGTAVRG